MDLNNPPQSEPIQAPQQAAPELPTQPAAQDDYDWQQSFSSGNQTPEPAPANPVDGDFSQPQSNPYLEQARELGINVPENATIDDVANAVIQQYREMTPYANYGRGLMPHAQQISDLLVRSTQQPEPPPADPEPEWNPSDHFKQQWNAPEWKEQYNVAIQNGMVERNPQTGLFQAAPGYEQMVIGILPGLNEAHQFQAQKWQGLMRGNPYENFYEALREPFQRSWTEDIRKEIERQFGRQQRMGEVQRFEQENAAWMYQQDQTGNYVPTEQGREFLGHVKMLRENGMRDPGQIINVATRMMGASLQQPAQPQQPQQQAPQGSESPNTIPFQQPKPSPQQTFLQNALDRAGHSPQSGAATVDSPDAPVHMSQGDLENAFINAHRAKQGRAS